MKRTVCCILILVLLSTFVSCDISHLCSLDVLCLNENANIVINGEKCDSYNFSSKELNNLPLETYSRIDFSARENNGSYAKVYIFEISSSENSTYNLSLKLAEQNKYVVDFLRIGIIIDGELRVYKYYDKYETIYHKENDPDSILHFNSKSEIFNDLSIDLPINESKEIAIFLWLEESELYDRNGERYTGWADKSHKASPILLNFEIN